MRRYRIGICCSDTLYAESLALALERESGGAFLTTCFSGPEKLNGFIALRELDLILSEWAPAGEKQDKELSIPFINLTSRPTDGGIFMFQSVHEIAQEILVRLKPLGQSSHPSGCLAVFSPLGRCGKTTLARAIASADSSGTGIYIGLEDFGERPVHSELLYMARQRIEGFIEAAEAEICTADGISELVLSGITMDARDVQSADLRWLSEQLLRSGRYTTVSFDLGTGVISDPEILLIFEHIFLPVLGDDVSLRKLETFFSNMKMCGLGGCLSRIRTVEVPKECCDSRDYEGVLRSLMNMT